MTMKSCIMNILQTLNKFAILVAVGFISALFFGLKNLILQDIPLLHNGYSLDAARPIVFDVLTTLASIMILGRKKIGVWLWIAVIPCETLFLLIGKGFTGFDAYYFLKIMVIVAGLCFLYVKKDGKTAWSQLK